MLKRIFVKIILKDTMIFLTDFYSDLPLNKLPLPIVQFTKGLTLQPFL